MRDLDVLDALRQSVLGHLRWPPSFGLENIASQTSVFVRPLKAQVIVLDAFLYKDHIKFEGLS